MSLAGLMTREVTIVRAATTIDRYHNTVPDWSSTTATATKGWLSETSSDEPAADGRRPEVATWVLYLPADVDIEAADRVVIDYVPFEIVGPPNRVRTPRGEHHIEAQLRRVEG